MSTTGKRISKEETNRRAELIAELQKLGEMVSTEAALFHQKAAEKYGLGLTDMKALSVLHSEGSMAAGRIAERLALTTGAVTNLVDRLEARGIVERVADPNDRRKVIVSVNDAVLANGPNHYQSMGDSFARLHKSYTTGQLEFLVEYHRAELDLTRKEIARLAADGSA